MKIWQLVPALLMVPILLIVFAPTIASVEETYCDVEFTQYTTLCMEREQ